MLFKVSLEDVCHITWTPRSSLTNIYVTLPISEIIPATKLAFQGLPLKAKCERSVKSISRSPFDYSKYIPTAPELFIRAALHTCIVHLPVSQLGREVFLIHVTRNSKAKECAVVLMLCERDSVCACHFSHLCLVQRKGVGGCCSVRLAGCKRVFFGGTDSVWSVKSILAESPCWSFLYLDISCEVSGTC